MKSSEPIMSFTPQVEAPPLTDDGTGGLRVGESRVLLEMVIGAFQDGATAETIVQQYPSATLADVYAVIAYYLRHTQEIEQYLAKRQKRGEEVRKRIEAGQKDLTEIRARLKARRGN
jgi:uncharacterized protein (DUF433 family)